jgi:hypothetical protein
LKFMEMTLGSVVAVQVEPERGEGIKDRLGWLHPLLKVGPSSGYSRPNPP